MNGYNFTERVRKILAIARDEAEQREHDYIGPEHMLLGIVREGEGVAHAVLMNLGANGDEIVAAVDRLLARGRPSPADRAVHGPDLVYTHRAKKALELAMQEARDLGHQYVGSEHLLLGVLREETAIAAQALGVIGVTLESARTETLRLLGHQPPRADAPTPQTPTRPDAASTSRITDQLREQVAWNRLTRALDISQRLGTPPALTLEADGTLTVPLGPDLVVSVEFPPGVRLRPRAGAPNATRPDAADGGRSAEERD